MKTYSTKAADIQRQWHVIDASGKVLGKLATQAATLLMGKHKPIFSPNLDTGDFVVIINAEKVSFSGNKENKKLYRRHSGYPGGLKSVSLEKMLETDPTRVIEKAVKGMLPTNRLRAVRMRKLKVYVGEAHPHLAQTGTTEKEDLSG
jgi:large subunit ribosomal protein L13